MHATERGAGRRAVPRPRGIHVRTIDTKVGGYRHDVTRQAVAEELISSAAVRCNINGDPKLWFSVVT